ncbi:hypothetical protein [Kitasatospora sp. NPDC056181]|uniref:hypothetical protein n=1 Tax=Kitasatospora sp. NPDC056181 TaxID=3345737 RepID=UPI0035D66607
MIIRPSGTLGIFPTNGTAAPDARTRGEACGPLDLLPSPELPVEDGGVGTGGENPWSDDRQENRAGQEQDVEDPDDDGWNDGAGLDRHSPAPPYTGLGLWDAHKEAELW